MYECKAIANFLPLTKIYHPVTPKFYLATNCSWNLKVFEFEPKFKAEPVAMY